MCHQDQSITRKDWSLVDNQNGQFNKLESSVDKRVNSFHVIITENFVMCEITLRVSTWKLISYLDFNFELNLVRNQA